MWADRGARPVLDGSASPTPPGGRREHLTLAERAASPPVVIDTGKTHEGIALEIEK
jgi:hypothetical protein